MTSERARPAAGENELTRLRARLLADGVQVTELTDTNPGNHGLTDPRISEVLAAAAGKALHYQPDPRGLPAAREALAARFGGGPDDYWLTASTSEAYSWLFQLLADPGDRVAIPTPGYPLIEPLARLAGLEVARYRTFYVPPWEYDLDSLEGVAADPRTRALAVVNPNNPTGAVVSGEVGAAIAEICRRHQVRLIADEVFLPYSSAAPLAADFTLDGLSKLLAAPGLKLGWIRAPGLDAETAAALDLVADSYLSVSSIVQYALPELLSLADETVARVSQRVSGNLATLRARYGSRVRQSQGGWVAIVDLPPSEDASLALLRGQHLYAHPGWFYELDANALVISLLPESIPDFTLPG
jgi:aspartate/methionine/tyrosine aminotransferase